jgi:AAHS family 4-hydroxybenzoate transporter-like MFS transporter
MLVAENNDARIAPLAAPLPLLIVSFFLIMIDGYDMFIVAFLAPLITADLDLTPISMGQIFAAGLAGSMVGGLVLGPLADRIGRRPILTIALALAGGATILCSAATTFGQLAAIRFVAGFALGGVLAAVIPLTAEHFPPQRRNAAVTAMFLGYSFGAVLGGAITSMTMHLGWRALFVGTGILTLMLVPAAFLMQESLKRHDERSAGGSPIGGVTSAIAGLFKEGRFWATTSLSIGVFCMLLVAYMLNSWTPMIAVRSGIEPSKAALCGVFLNLGGITGALGSIFIIRKYGLFRPVAVMIVIGSLAIAAIGQLYGSTALLFSGLFVAGLFAIGGQQNTPAMAVEIYPQNIRAAGVGWQIAVGRLGSIAGPLIGGQLLSRNFDPQSIFMIVAIPAFLAAIAYGAVEYIRPKIVRPTGAT